MLFDKNKYFNMFSAVFTLVQAPDIKNGHQFIVVDIKHIDKST